MAPTNSNLAFYKEGVNVWIEHDEEGYASATVKSVDDEDIHLIVKGGKKIKKPFYNKKTGEMNELPPIVNHHMQWLLEDMTRLDYLHEPAILQVIQTRFESDMIYTYSGMVLVCVNPFKTMDIYSEDCMNEYRGRTLGELEPHLFGVAEEAYQSLRTMSQSQSIVVSGESGAGKTMSAKFVLKYLSHVAGSGNSESSIDKRLFATNPILEAIGNAKTTRNDNSSRFGKFMQILLTKDYQISGANIRTYLLEKSRVVSHAKEERNYHIFYQLLAGASAHLKLSLKLNEKTPASFRYTSQGVPTSKGMDDAQEFNDVVKGILTLGIEKDIVENMWKIISAILHLGDIKTNEGGIENDSMLQIASSLIGCESAELGKWLSNRKITVGKDSIVKPLAPKDQVFMIDGCAKDLYARVFNWIIIKINEKVGNQESINNPFIGILDIYGFESFVTNSFEQFCINYANEKLQEHFNTSIFKHEQQDYIKEGIGWSFIGFQDNTPCLNMIESKTGIVALLSEECVMAGGSDKNFHEKVVKMYISHDFFEVPRKAGTQPLFVIKHYAENVTYDCRGWLEKNKDETPLDIALTLAAGSNPLMAMLFPPAEDDSNAVNTPKSASKGTRRSPTVISQFKSSLAELMTSLRQTNTHYIRCIKPNEEKVELKLTRKMVLEQIRACGILSTIKVSMAGFPGKILYTDFAERYWTLHSQAYDQFIKKGGNDLKGFCEAAVKKYIEDPVQFQFGKTKLFLRAGNQAYFEVKRKELQSVFALRLQAFSRQIIARTRVEKRRKAVLTVQKICRTTLAKNRANLLRKERDIRIRKKAAIRIQNICRGFLAKLELARRVAEAKRVAEEKRLAEERRLAMEREKTEQERKAREKREADEKAERERQDRLKAEQEAAKAKKLANILAAQEADRLEKTRLEEEALQNNLKEEARKAEEERLKEESRARQEKRNQRLSEQKRRDEAAALAMAVGGNDALADAINEESESHLPLPRFDTCRKLADEGTNTPLLLSGTDMSDSEAASNGDVSDLNKAGGVKARQKKHGADKKHNRLSQMFNRLSTVGSYHNQHESSESISEAGGDNKERRGSILQMQKKILEKTGLKTVEPPKDRSFYVLEKHRDNGRIRNVRRLLTITANSVDRVDPSSGRLCSTLKITSISSWKVKGDKQNVFEMTVGDSERIYSCVAVGKQAPVIAETIEHVLDYQKYKKKLGKK